MINLVQLQQSIYRHSIAGFAAAAGQMQKDMDRVAGGEMLYSDGVWRRYPGGPKDLQVVARQAAAAPRAYRLKAGNADLPIFNIERDIPREFSLSRHSVRVRLNRSVASG